MDRDATTRDLTHQKIRMAKDVLVWPVREQGKLVYRLEIPQLHRFFRIGFEEYVLISCLNGNRTLPQACGLAAARLGRRAPTAVQAGTIVRWLLQNELAVLGNEPDPSRKDNQSVNRARRNRAATLWPHWLSKLNPFWIKLPFPKAEQFFNRWIGGVAPLFDPRCVLSGIVLIVIAATVLLLHRTEFVSSSSVLIHPSNWLWLLGSWIILKIIHELAHAIACYRQGATVRESGLVFILFAPMAYVDVSSCWRLPSRWSRIVVSAAGMYVELVIAALALLAWVYVEEPLLRFQLHSLVFTAGVSTLLFNANVLMRFDGYFMLADLIEVPNLYQQSAAEVRRFLSRLITGDQMGPSEFAGWRRAFAFGYGIAAFIWKVVICVSLFVAASAMFAGAGIVIAVLGIWLWSSRPLRHYVQFLVRLKGRSIPLLARALIVSALLAVFSAGTFFWLPIPTSIRVATVSHFQPESIIRSRADGFVVAVHAEDGAHVEQGQLLIELENRELSKRLVQLELSLQQNRIRLRQATGAHDAGKRHVLNQSMTAIQQQLDQVRTQVNGLRIHAPKAGTVSARRLETKLGTYVTEGEELMVLATAADKELIALVPQCQVDEVRELAGTNVQIRTPDFGLLNGRLERIEPRASVELTETSLAATEGGNLPVETVDESHTEQTLRLSEPYFRGRIELDPDTATRIPAGMRVTSYLGLRRDSLAVRIQTVIADVWYETHASYKD
ncbi:MAG: efflux RND transporter periplasmic adaptor subunit [Planctomycetota bacterium]